MEFDQEYNSLILQNQHSSIVGNDEDSYPENYSKYHNFIQHIKIRSSEGKQLISRNSISQNQSLTQPTVNLNDSQNQSTICISPINQYLSQSSSDSKYSCSESYKSPDTLIQNLKEIANIESDDDSQDSKSLTFEVVNNVCNYIDSKYSDKRNFGINQFALSNILVQDYSQIMMNANINYIISDIPSQTEQRHSQREQSSQIGLLNDSSNFTSSSISPLQSGDITNKSDKSEFNGNSVKWVVKQKFSDDHKCRMKYSFLGEYYLKELYEILDDNYIDIPIFDKQGSECRGMFGRVCTALQEYPQRKNFQKHLAKKIAKTIHYRQFTNENIMEVATKFKKEDSKEFVNFLISKLKQIGKYQIKGLVSRNPNVKYSLQQLHKKVCARLKKYEQRQ